MKLCILARLQFCARNSRWAIKANITNFSRSHLSSKVIHGHLKPRKCRLHCQSVASRMQQPSCCFFPVCLVVCDPYCTSTCNVYGPGMCDTTCATGYELNVVTHQCQSSYSVLVIMQKLCDVLNTFVKYSF
jgi:hypothetical protein